MLHRANLNTRWRTLAIASSNGKTADCSDVLRFALASDDVMVRHFLRSGPLVKSLEFNILPRFVAAAQITGYNASNLESQRVMRAADRYERKRLFFGVNQRSVSPKMVV
jgi:hypothetical protein